MKRNLNAVFSRDHESEKKNPDWFSDYVKNLEKVSVRSIEEDRSMFDQISQIMGTKSKYSSVEEAVQDMQNRSGLAQYLKQQTAMVPIEANASIETEPSIVQHAFEQFQLEKMQPEGQMEIQLDKDRIPKVIRDNPELEEAIRDFVRERFGRIHPIAVVDKIRVWLKDRGTESDEINDKHLAKFINDIIIDEKKLNQNEKESFKDIGKLDKSVDDEFGDDGDAFAVLMPATN